MRIRVAPNVVADSAGDAARIAWPVRRLARRRTRRRLENAATHDERDALLRRESRRLLRAADAHLLVRGLSHIDLATSYLVTPLHESLVDVPLLIASLPLPLTFVARADLDAEKPMAGLLSASRQIMINPESSGSLRSVIRQTALLRAQGRSVVIFPQGSVLGIETAFLDGACAVAERLEMPVLPVVVAGTHRIWEHPFSPRVRCGQPAYVEVLPPQLVDGPTDYRDVERRIKAAALANGWAEPRHYLPGRDGYWDEFRFEIDPDYPNLARLISERRLARASTETAIEPLP